MVYEYQQDDPRKCTSHKLQQFHLARKLPTLKSIPTQSIVLNPSDETILSRTDRPIVQRHGLVALDCSWKRSDEIFQRRFPGKTRRLPTLLAGNPTNYASLGKLSTVEALAAALYITDFVPQAKRLLSIFKWGQTFLTLNKDPLEAYSKSDDEDMRREENEFFPGSGG